MDATLVMFKENGERRDFSLLKETTAVGRREDCDLRIPLASVSRSHCQFVISGKRISVKDLGSSNGTYVNNVRVAGTVELKAGDHVAVGPVVFTLQIDGQPADIASIEKTPPTDAGPESPTRMDAKTDSGGGASAV